MVGGKGVIGRGVWGSVGIRMWRGKGAATHTYLATAVIEVVPAGVWVLSKGHIMASPHHA